MSGAIDLLKAIKQHFYWRRAPQPGQEIIYRELFLRALRQNEIEDIFTPIGAAANHGLLYAIIEAVTRVGTQSVLEFGAGQSTLLLDQLARRRPGLKVRTIEHDPLWAGIIGGRVSHEIRTGPLTPIEAAGRQIQYYDTRTIADPGEQFELVLVDGPPAYTPTTRYNRVGFLKVLEQHLADNFVIIIDDIDRWGEQFCIAETRRFLKRRGRVFSEGSVRAAKMQYVFAGGAYGSVGFP